MIQCLIAMMRKISSYRAGVVPHSGQRSGVARRS